MRKLFFIITIILIGSSSLSSQNTLQDGRKLYLEEKYEEALPIFASELKVKPNDASINHWYGVSLYKTGGDLELAIKSLKIGAERKIQESNFYLGLIYADLYNFDEAEKYFDAYKIYLNRKERRSNAQKKQDAEALDKLAILTTEIQKTRRIVSHTEDIQIIDSVIVKKDDFLSSYNLSFSGGSISHFSKIFKTDTPIQSTVYFNEKGTKMYYATPDTSGIYTLLTMDFLVDQFENEQKMSTDNFGIDGDLNYPFIMSDGVTVYFAAQDSASIGGYDLFVSRYNINTDTYLRPERLNMPFNSKGNDYMLVVDEEKGVGWFASDRSTGDDEVCIYTFIPNSTVIIIQSKDSQYIGNRSRISSIKDTWKENEDYSKLIASARTKPIKKQIIHKDFEFVINDDIVYYTLQDFKNIKARDNYFKIVQMKSELGRIAEKLDAERSTYSKASPAEKDKLNYSIIQLEERERTLNKALPNLEIDARTIEVDELKNNI